MSQTIPLHHVHEAAGAQFTDFSGWMMPVRYSSDLAEHHQVRDNVGLFDLSHMAEIEVWGGEAGAFLDFCFAGSLSGLEVGRAKYSLLLNEAGGILDDVIVYCTGENAFLVVANAGNREVVWAAMNERAKGFDASLRDDTDETVMLAVQGPNALAVLQKMNRVVVQGSLPDLGYYRCLPGMFEGAPLLIARTGYTGEDGFELYVPTAQGEALWNAVMEAGHAFGIAPCGLAARDTLRLEAGMPLYGHELGTEIRPAQAGLGKVVAAQKERFVGKDALASWNDPSARVLVAIVADGKRAARAGYAVQDSSGRVIGEVTSGALSPTLGYPIAMAFVDPSFQEPGTEVLLDVRGTPIPATISSLPFYRRRKD